MKTKAFFVLCLLAGIVALPLSAQNSNSSDSKTFQGWFMSSYWSPVYCGDSLVDNLSGGTISVHYVAHIEDGKYRWETDQIKGEVQSQTGETFQIREVDKYTVTDHWVLTWSFNLIGDGGTHYIGTLTLDYGTGVITVGKTVCIYK